MSEPTGALPLYRIRNWEKHFENNRTRELKRLEWVPMRNKQDGDGYRAIMAHSAGLQILGAWLLFCEVASKCDPRGILKRENGEPHTAATISRITGAGEARLQMALEFLCNKDVEWMEAVSDECQLTESTSEQKRAAQGRVSNALARGYGVCTPTGIITDRPAKCQWCGADNVPQGRYFPSLVAHHIIGYGSKERDLTVVFVCRSCHGAMENNRVLVADVFDRFGSAWLRKVVDIACVTEECGSESQSTAIPSLEWKGMEGNGTEGNGTRISSEPKAKPSRSERIAWDGDAQNWTGIEDSDIAGWKEAYPALEIRQQLSQMRQWYMDNPTKHKRNVSRFITNWLARKQEKAGVGSERQFSASPRQSGASQFAPSLQAQLKAVEDLLSRESAPDKRKPLLARKWALTEQIAKG